jgi:hypothetical protein
MWIFRCSKLGSSSGGRYANAGDWRQLQGFDVFIWTPKELLVVFSFLSDIFYKVFSMLLSWSTLQISHVFVFERASSIPRGFVYLCNIPNLK